MNIPSTPPQFIATDHFEVTAVVTDPNSKKDPQYTLDLGIFATFTGADIDSSTALVHPGGMTPPVVLGSTRTTADITLTKPFQFGDHGHIWNLRDRVGRAIVTINKRPLDAEGNYWGTGFIFTGVLKGITHPDHDAESQDRASWSIVVTPDGTIGTVV